MSGNRLAHFATYAAMAAFFCAFVFSQTTHAAPVPVTTVNFSGSSVCEIPSPFSGACFGAEDVTGSFEFNPATNSVVGSWSFFFSVGFTLSSFQDDQVFVTQPQPNIDNFFFTDGFNYIDLDYASPIAPGALALDGSLQLCGVGPQDCSIGAFTTGIVPEPSTLPLVLIGGVLGLFSLRSLRRRSSYA